MGRDPREQEKKSPAASSPLALKKRQPGPSAHNKRRRPALSFDLRDSGFQKPLHLRYANLRFSRVPSTPSLPSTESSRLHRAVFDCTALCYLAYHRARKIATPAPDKKERGNLPGLYAKRRTASPIHQEFCWKPSGNLIVPRPPLSSPKARPGKEIPGRARVWSFP